MWEMNRTPLIRSAFAIALGVAALHAEAKDALEVVSLRDRAQRETLDNQQYLAATVSARLGEWFEFKVEEIRQ